MRRHLIIIDSESLFILKNVFFVGDKEFLSVHIVHAPNCSHLMKQFINSYLPAARKDEDYETLSDIANLSYWSVGPRCSSTCLTSVQIGTAA